MATRIKTGGRGSRRKGANAENELCRLLSEELGITIKRNIGQARAGGADCLELSGFALEVKRCEQFRKPSWWAQAVAQGEKAGAEPIVFYRRNGEPWQALIRTADGGYRDAAWPAAVLYVREKLARLPVYREAA